MLDIIELTNDKMNPGLIVLIDFEKAFDTISWKLMENVLKIYSIPNHNVALLIMDISPPFLNIKRNLTGLPVVSYSFCSFVDLAIIL